jgi:predicted  nucleic acid-binding Zn-ribbon protein
MSEEKLDLIQNQLSQLLQGMGTMQQDVGVLKQDVGVLKQDVSELKQDVSELKQDIVAMKQNDNALREDIVDLRNRIGSIEGAIMLIVRDGFTPLRNYADDLNFELSEVQRKNRLLNRRVRRMERRDLSDDFEY